MTQAVKNLPAVPETQVQSLGQEEALEKGMATHSSILAWRIPQTEEPAGPQTMGSQKVSDTTEQLTHTITLQGCVNLLFKEVSQLCVCLHPLPLIFFFKNTMKFY